MRPASRPATCATIDWTKVSALRAVARRAAHPSRAALDGGAGARRRRRDHRRHRAVLPRAARASRRHAPFVAITGTNGKSTTTALIAHILRAAGRDVQTRRQYRHRDPALEPPRAGPRPRHRVSSFQIDLAPSLDPSVGILLNVTPDHLDRHGTMRALRRGQGAAGRRRAADGTAVDRRRRRLVRGDRRPRSSAQGKHVVRISVRRPLADGIYAEGGADLSAATGGDGATDRAISPASARCAARTTPRTPPARPRRALGARARRGGDPGRACGRFPGLAHRMEEVGARARCSSSTIPRRPMPMPRRRRWPRFDRHLLDRRRQAEGGRHRVARRTSFPRIAKAYLIGEAAADFAATLDGKVAVRDRRHARRGGRARRPRRRRAPTRRAGRAAVAGLRLLRPVPEFRGARRRASASSCWRCRASSRRRSRRAIGINACNHDGQD